MDVSIFSRYWKALTQPTSATEAPRVNSEQDKQDSGDQKEKDNQQSYPQDSQRDVQHDVPQTIHQDGQRGAGEDAQAEIQFLSLPPEVRNMIYRFALVEGDIHVHATTSQHALLQVSRQLRQEAISIYYKENYFYFAIWAFDATIYIKWCSSSRDRQTAKTKWKLRGPRNWTNLLHWLEVFYNGGCRAPGVALDAVQLGKSGKTDATAMLFKLVKKMKIEQGSTWQDVKANLGLVHASFCVIDRTWERQRDST